MTEMENSIYDFEISLKNNNPAYITRGDCELAIEALKEKAEMEKGCEWCDDHNYKQPSDWIWGERIHIIKPHYFCVGDGIAHYEEAEYCPKCGRKLVSEE